MYDYRRFDFYCRKEENEMRYQLTNLAEFCGSRWEGSERILMKTKVINGTKTFMDKYITISLTFEEVEYLWEQMKEGKKRLAEQEKRTAKINEGNNQE